MLNFLTAVVMAASPVAPPVVDPSAMTAAKALVKQIDVRGQLNKALAQNVAAMRSGYAIRAQLAQQPGFVRSLNPWIQPRQRRRLPRIASAFAERTTSSFRCQVR